MRVIGGHSIRNEDMVFGYAVTGVIDPHRIWRNVGAQPGDALLFTKPLGTGVITTALKKDRATPSDRRCHLGNDNPESRRRGALHEMKEKSEATSHPCCDRCNRIQPAGSRREMALGDPGQEFRRLHSK